MDECGESLQITRCPQRPYMVRDPSEISELIVVTYSTTRLDRTTQSDRKPLTGSSSQGQAGTPSSLLRSPDRSQTSRYRPGSPSAAHMDALA